MTLVLLLGGARSGKSDLALRLASEQPAPVAFIATATAGDAEMVRRIAEHRRERPSSWETIEEPLRLAESIRAASEGHCLVIDCLTLWTANILDELGVAAAEAEARKAAAFAAARRGLTLAVTNEVGLGLVPDNPLGRSYRDLLGRVNAIWAAEADRALLVIAGRMLTLEKTDSRDERI